MWGNNPRRNDALLEQIVRLRVLVGYLGEKAQFGWWPTEFYSSSSSAFLTPVFGRTASLARYHGVREAARRVHDEHIGVGRVFHLFRLPGTMEQSLFELLQAATDAVPGHEHLSSNEAALRALEAQAASAAAPEEGPIQIGTTADLEGNAWLTTTARCYHAAFTHGVRSYPYLLERS